MKLLDNPPALSASVDWFSASVRSSQQRNQCELLFRALGQQAVSQGEKTLLADWKGYRITRIGFLTWGHREADDYIELRSSAAATQWVYFWPLVHHTARIDLAVTWTPPKPRLNLAKALYGATTRIIDRGHLPPKLRYFETFGEGQTFYIGSPKSARLGRIYDKGVELGVLPPGELWRYEVQLRDDVAAATAEMLARSDDQGGDVAAIVATFYKQRLVNCDWASNLEYLPIVVHRAKSSDEVRKRWLISTVRPVVRELGKRVTRGELESYLGLAALDR